MRAVRANRCWLKQNENAPQVGSGLDPATTMGPLITPDAVDRVVSRLEDAVSKGATVATGGSRPGGGSGGNGSGGNFFEPTVVTGATIDMRVFRCGSLGFVGCCVC